MSLEIVACTKVCDVYMNSFILLRIFLVQNSFPLAVLSTPYVVNKKILTQPDTNKQRYVTEPVFPSDSLT